MIDLFDLASVNRAASAFNPEKLLWLNQQYIIHEPDPQRLAELLRDQLRLLGTTPAADADLHQVFGFYVG